MDLHFLFPDHFSRQDLKELPVSVRTFMPEDLSEPLDHTVLLRFRQLFPQITVSVIQSQRNGRHFHHPLIEITDLSPVIRVRRIGSVTDPTADQLQPFCIESIDSRSCAPEHPGKSLDPRDPVPISDSVYRIVDPRRTAAVIFLQRIIDPVEQVKIVCFALQTFFPVPAPVFVFNIFLLIHSVILPVHHSHFRFLPDGKFLSLNPQQSLRKKVI